MTEKPKDKGRAPDPQNPPAEGDGQGTWKKGSGYFGSRGQSEAEHEPEPENENLGSAGAFSEGALRTTAPPPAPKPQGEEPDR